MEPLSATYVDLLRSGASKLTGHHRRIFVAEVTLKLCHGSARVAESRFGWGRETIRKGLQELAQGKPLKDNFQARGAKRSEAKNPALAAAIRELAEPATQTDPELKSERRYLNLSSREVLAGLQANGWPAADLPSERSMRRILNRLGYRLKRIQKGRPLKKTAETDAVFANINAVKASCRGDPNTLEISADTKAKVAIGQYSRGGKNPHSGGWATGQRLGS